MMFGSMPMKLVGNSVKIHYVKSEQQLILTKIFTAQHRSMPTCRVADFSESCPLPGHLYSAADNSLTVPSVSPGNQPLLILSFTSTCSILLLHNYA